MSATALKPGTAAPAAQSAPRGMTVRTVRSFFALTFALSWGAGVLYVLFAEQIESLFGPMGYTNPAFILAVYGPAFAGVILVWRYYGPNGLGRFFRRLTLWRMSWRWWLVLALGIPAVYYAGAVINGTLTDPFPFSPWYAVVPAMAPALLIGPIEEFGWRGVALPLLQRQFRPLWAALIVGVVAAIWHIPSFLLSGTKQSSWAIAPFLVGVVAVAVILTAMFNASRGSLLVAALFHFQLNGPAWPDAQPWDMIVFTIVAVVVVLVNRRAMLSRDGAATEVLLGEAAAPAEPTAPA